MNSDISKFNQTKPCSELNRKALSQLALSPFLRNCRITSNTIPHSQNLLKISFFARKTVLQNMSCITGNTFSDCKRKPPFLTVKLLQSVLNYSTRGRSRSNSVKFRFSISFKNFSSETP